MDMEKQMGEEQQTQEQEIRLPVSKWLNFISNLYILLIGGLLPLYHVNGFSMIGDRKYRLFFIVSIIMVPLMLVLYLIKWSAAHVTGEDELLRADNLLSEDERLRADNPLSGDEFGKIKDHNWNLLDIFALVYGISALISFGCSSYKETALRGYEDWHMGLVSQLLFVGIYFTISRCWKINRWIVRYLLLISGVIFTLGILNRFAIDPLHMYDGLEYWNKTHLLATLGNINWYCGYACVFIPIGLWMYIEFDGKRYGKQYGKSISCISYILITCFVIVSFGTMVTQGSESGIATLLVVMSVLLGFAIEDRRKVKRFLELNLILGITTWILGRLYLLCDKEQMYFAVDLQIEKLLLNPYLKYYIVIILFSYLALCLIPIDKIDIKALKMKKVKYIYFITLAIVYAISGIVIISHMNPDWGSGRGLLWTVSWNAYKEMPLVNQLFGVGADCYAPYMGAHSADALSGFLAEWWGDAVVACAHNEWLNTLINLGAVGLVTYLGLFIAAGYLFYQTVHNTQTGHNTRITHNMQVFKSVPKLEKMTEKEKLIFLGACILCIVSYCVNSSVSFQQVLSTPMIFLLIGMGESVRKELIK